MRKILFKAKRKDNGEWVKGYYCQVEDRHYIVSNNAEIGLSAGDGTDLGIFGFIEVDPETVGQCVPNKNLWEGDICKAEYCCAVCYDSDPHLLTGTIEQDDNGLWMFGYGHGAIPLDSEDLEITEVIGTVAENPELLEGKK